MALVKCTECGKEISDKATMCPNCGCPLESSVKDESNDKLKRLNKKTKLYILIGMIAFLVVIIFAIFNGGSKLVRDAKWGESLNTVLKREQKKLSENDLKVFDTSIRVSNQRLYEQEYCELCYFFDDRNELNEIRIFFMSYDYYDMPETVDRQFLEIVEVVEKELGNSDSSETEGIIKTVKWSFNDTFVTLDYDFTDEEITLTFERQN